MKKKLVYALIPLTFIVMLSGSLMSFTSSERYYEIAKNLDIFATLYKEINKYYVDDVDPNKLVKTGIDAMLKSLDPYTNYIPEDRIEDYRFMTTGQYGGIGAVIGKRKGESTVLSPYVGFPAHKAGLRIGDVIKIIDDIKIKGKNTGQVSKLLKGQAGTKLTLQIERFGVDSLITVDITREKIKVDNVPYYGMITKDVGYIELTGFTQTASREVKDAMSDLKKQGAQKVVLDLRGNGGGLLKMAIEISNVFVNKNKEVVSTKGKMKDWNRTYKTTELPMDLDIPLAVLTNGGSASASEIVSGVMQDYDRGVLIGRTTFGKGLVQATRPLTDKAQLKVTTAKYYIPSGRCIQALDYANKKNGKAMRTADSSRIAFRTDNGRLVYDGKGLDPDVKVEAKKYSDIARALSSKYLFFDFAVEYRHKHEKIAPAKEFDLTDQEYDEFVAWLGDKEYSYKTKVEEGIDAMRKTAEKEELLDQVKDELDQMEANVKKSKGDAIAKNKEEIKELLENQIVKHYYFNKGSVEATFDDDRDIKMALEILNDSERYKKILTGEKI